MSATYAPTLDTDKDWVRLLIGDRDITKAVVSDEEIDAALIEYKNKYLAAAWLGEHVILAGGKGVVSKSVGDLSITYGGLPEDAYRKHLDKLREKGAELLLKLDGGSHILRVL